MAPVAPPGPAPAGDEPARLAKSSTALHWLRGMCLNEYGRLVEAVWHGLPNHYPHVRLDAYVIKPNHVHGILVLVEAGLKPASTAIVRHGLPAGNPEGRAFAGFKLRCTNRSSRTPVGLGLVPSRPEYRERVKLVAVKGFP